MYMKKYIIRQSDNNKEIGFNEEKEMIKYVRDNYYKKFYLVKSGIHKNKTLKEQPIIIPFQDDCILIRNEWKALKDFNDETKIGALGYFKPKKNNKGYDIIVNNNNLK